MKKTRIIVSLICAIQLSACDKVWTYEQLIETLKSDTIVFSNETSYSTDGSEYITYDTSGSVYDSFTGKLSLVRISDTHYTSGLKIKSTVVLEFPYLSDVPAYYNGTFLQEDNDEFVSTGLFVLPNLIESSARIDLIGFETTYLIGNESLCELSAKTQSLLLIYEFADWAQETHKCNIKKFGLFPKVLA